jgi:transposase-like protein
VTTATPSYQGHRYPVEIINHCVWLYFGFPLSFGEVEELRLVRGVAVSYETIRRWCATFGQAYANQLRRRRPRPGDKWHLEEVFVGINGRLGYLWRAVDQLARRSRPVTPKRGGACWSPTRWAATRSPTASSCRRWSTGGRGI